MNLQVILAITIGMFITNLDSTIVNIAYPSMASQFGVGTDQVSLVELSYLIMICALLPLFAKIGERKGTAFVMRMGYVIFTVATLLCALSSNLIMLIIARGIQGIGGAMLMAVGNALIVAHISERYRGRAFGINTVLGAVGFAVGSPLGGLLTEHLGWRSVFFVSIIPAVAGLLLAKRHLSDPPPVPARGGLDVVGSLSFFVFFGALVMFLNKSGDIGISSPQVKGLIVMGMAAFVLFIIAEKRAADPLITLRLFRHRGIVLGLLGGLACVTILDGMFFILPFYFQQAQGYSITGSGLLLGVFPLLAMGGSPLAGWLVDRYNARLVCIGAGVLLIAGTFLFTGFTETTTLAMTLATAAVFSLGISMFLPANTAMVMGHGSAASPIELSALYSLTQAIGSAVGVAGMEMAYSFGANGEITSVAMMTKGLQRAALVAVIIATGLTLASFVGKIGLKTPDKCAG